MTIISYERSFEKSYSHRKELHWKYIPKSASALYHCKAKNINDGEIIKRAWAVNVLDASEPTVEVTTIVRSEEKRLVGEPFELTCKINGMPRPYVQWFKDDVPIVCDGNDARLTIENKNTTFRMYGITVADEGKYSCDGSNRYGRVYRETMLKVVTST